MTLPGLYLIQVPTEMSIALHINKALVHYTSGIMLMGIRQESQMEHCKPQVNTGTTWQPGITVNPPQRQEPAISLHTERGQGHK